MLGSLEIFSRRDGLLEEQLGAVVGTLGELDLGFRGAARILIFGERLEIIRLGLVYVRRFQVGQLLPLADDAALTGVKANEPTFMNRADVCHAILGDEDLPGGNNRPGDGLWHYRFGLYGMACGRLRGGCARLPGGRTCGRIRSLLAAATHHCEKRREQEGVKVGSEKHIGHPFARAATFAEALRSPFQDQVATSGNRKAPGNNWPVFHAACGSHRASRASSLHRLSMRTP